MTSSKSRPIWKPDSKRINAASIKKFGDFVDRQYQQKFDSYDDLHKWSITNTTHFWSALWDYCGVQGKKSEPLVEDGDKMPGARFFPNAELNFSQNLLRQTGSQDAIVFRGENKVKIRLSWDKLHAQVSKLQQAFVAAGINKGDRIAAMLPNRPEAIIGLLAASSLGAVWSSCSPDFGKQGVLDRFCQIEPKIFMACDGYWYNGKKIDVSEKVKSICTTLNVEKIIVIDYLEGADDLANQLDNANTFDDLIDQFEACPVKFLQLPFDHPLYILFSSGTTGIPKCIVHSQGGILLQHLKEHQLHCNMQTGDKVFHFTTLGWMMWNWLISALASGVTLMLYDGSPFYPDGNVLFDYAEQEKFTLFGTSAKFIDALRNAGLSPINTHELSHLQVMTSTGSPLADENFKYVYSDIKSDIHLASMSGGTDIAACFVIGVPTKPVYTGEIQGPALGMATEVFSPEATPLTSEKGELVCTKPFPSMPIKFWNDDSGEKYHNAYFNKFDNIWCHGDFAQWTPNGGMIIHGRSDATLNPGGVRIGTAEIYNIVEQMDEIDEAICIAHQWDGGQGDVRVVLFVVLAQKVELNDELIAQIKQRIKTGASPRHVPSHIIKVTDIPRTKSGKITEIAVRDVVHGREVHNKEALANPQALELFRNLPQLS